MVKKEKIEHVLVYFMCFVAVGATFGVLSSEFLGHPHFIGAYLGAIAGAAIAAFPAFKQAGAD